MCVGGGGGGVNEQRVISKGYMSYGLAHETVVCFLRKPWRDILTYYLSLITNYLLLITYYLLLTTYYLLLITYYLSLIIYHIIYHPYNDGKLH